MDMISLGVYICRHLHELDLTFHLDFLLLQQE